MIRPYRKDDEAAAHALISRVLAEFGFTAVESVAQDLAAATVTYAAPRGGFWVAEEAGALVGTVAVRPKSEDACELKRLYVDATQRGRGLGHALYAHAEAFARAAGYRRIWLDSSRKFTGARRLYERNGFRLVREVQNEWCDNEYEKVLEAGADAEAGAAAAADADADADAGAGADAGAD